MNGCCWLLVGVCCAGVGAAVAVVQGRIRHMTGGGEVRSEGSEEGGPLGGMPRGPLGGCWRGPGASGAER